MGIKVKVTGGLILIQDASREQFGELTGSGKFKWDKFKFEDRRTGEVKAEKALMAPANMDSLDFLKSVLRKHGLSLPPDTARLWKELHAVQDAVDAERTKEKPEPMFRYPVKMPLYLHQTRAANMALLTFGWVAPEGGIA